MKKIIVLMMAIVMMLSMTACFGMGGTSSSTADQAVAADVETYDKDFDGLVKYISDRNSNAAKNELYYDIVGAKNGVRLVLNGNAYVEIYDFTEVDNSEGRTIIDAVKTDGKFRPMENGTEMTGKLTESGKYLLAWDATRSYDYDKNVATEELIANW